MDTSGITATEKEGGTAELFLRRVPGFKGFIKV